MRADRLEQLFLTPRGGRYVALLVLESEAGARERVTLQPPGAGVTGAAESAAARYVARWLWQQGGEPLTRLRVRVQRSGTLEDAPALRAEVLREHSRLRGEG